MADKTYEQFKTLVNLCDMPCCVMSVKKNPDGSCGEIHMFATNEQFSMTGEDVEGKEYTYKLPRDPKMEKIWFDAAWNEKSYHGYIDTTRLYGFWTDNYIIPLKHDEDSDTGYCQLLYTLTKEMDAGKYSTISPEVASFVIRTCLNLRKEEDFYSSMDLVTRDLRKFTGSYSSCIMTISPDVYKYEIISESVQNNEKSLRDIFAMIPYEIIDCWEGLVAETDCVIITNEEDMKYYEEKAPKWVVTLRDNDVHSLCLVPFIHQNTIIGYLYITNFDTDETAKLKDTIELVSFFLSTEAAHHLFVDRLRDLSSMDTRTGVLNRNAMNNKVDELAAQLRYEPAPFSVAFCYLNTLKTINVNQGHDAGNNLLKDAGKLLKEVFKGDYIYRSSGDEFAIISMNCDAKEFKNKIELLKSKANDPNWIYFTVGYYSDASEGELHSAMHFANEYEHEFNEEFYNSYPDMVK